ncbi:MAG: hypothetical protein Q8J66_06380 [Methylotenera sp.]|nr:hypothetical protein [Methylotenera sp.]
MTLQEQLDQLVLKRADKAYYQNHVVLYQRIFDDIKKSNKELAFCALKAKAHAWASRSRDDFLTHINDIVKKQKDPSYKDNPYTEIYLKYLNDEKKLIGY